MKNNTKTIIFLSFGVLLAVLVISGATFASFRAFTSANGSNISGVSYELNASVVITPVRSGNLIPVKDNLIMTSLNGSYPCEDSRGYSLCSLYKVNLTNSGAKIDLNGYVLSNTGTSFTTNYLKYQLLTKSGSTYTSASDINTINIANNSKNYLKLSNSNINFSLNSGASIERYLVIWLSDPGNVNQLDDVNKTYNGSLVFESSNGGTVTAKFTS